MRTPCLACILALGFAAPEANAAGGADGSSRISVEAEVAPDTAGNPLDRLGDFVATYRYNSVRPNATISGVTLDEKRAGSLVVKRVGSDTMIALSTESPRAIDRDGVPRLTWVRNADAWFLENGVFLHELSGNELIEIPAPATFIEEIPPLTTDLGYSWTGGQLETTASCVQRALDAGGTRVEVGGSPGRSVHEVIAPGERFLGAIPFHRITRWTNDPASGKPKSQELLERYTFPDGTAIDVVVREREVFRRMDELASGIRIRLYDAESILNGPEPQTPEEFRALLGEDGRPPLSLESTFELVEFRSPREGELADVRAVEGQVVWVREKWDSEPRRAKVAATEAGAGSALLRYDAASARFVPATAQP